MYCGIWGSHIHTCIHTFHGYVYHITVGCGVSHKQTIYTKDAKHIIIPIKIL